MRFSEKATQFDKIPILVLTLQSIVKTKIGIFSIFRHIIPNFKKSILLCNILTKQEQLNVCWDPEKMAVFDFNLNQLLAAQNDYPFVSIPNKYSVLLILPVLWYSCN